MLEVMGSSQLFLFLECKTTSKRSSMTELPYSKSVTDESPIMVSAPGVDIGNRIVTEVG